MYIYRYFTFLKILKYNNTTDKNKSKKGKRTPCLTILFFKMLWIVSCETTQMTLFLRTFLGNKFHINFFRAVELIAKTNLDFSRKTETMGTTNSHGTLITLGKKKKKMCFRENFHISCIFYFLHLMWGKSEKLMQSVNPKLKPNVYNEVRQFISWNKCASL